MNHPRSRLAYWITRFVNHKRALGFSYQGPEFVLRALCRHVESCGYSDLNAQGFDSWMATYQKHHPNTRSKWYSTVRYFCLYRRRREPDCFLPTADGVPKRQPHLLPVIVEPEQIARMLPLASNLLPNYQSPLRAPTTRLSTIFLASAIRDNGAGKVITTEFEPEKAEQAKKNVAAAGLAEWVEFRIGDALDTLSDPPRQIDMIFLDGAKGLYFDVLKLLEPNLRCGGIVASDNTDHKGMEAFLEYIRNSSNGYTSAGVYTGAERGKAHEITIRH